MYVYRVMCMTCFGLVYIKYFYEEFICGFKSCNLMLLKTEYQKAKNNCPLALKWKEVENNLRVSEYNVEQSIL